MSLNDTVLQDQVILRYRAHGHIRFEIPQALCVPEIADVLTQQTQKQEGVYRVILYKRHQKLSIRYLDTVCTFHEVCQHLNQVVNDIAQRLHSPAPEKPDKHQEKVPLKERIERLSWVQWIRSKYQLANRIFQGANIVTRKKLGLPAAPPLDTERVIINFLNDLVSFYLIKLHWNKISHQWLKHPIKYRYQWFTVFYLIFLMVRYRKALWKKRQ
jgi:hypothetical protein